MRERRCTFTRLLAELILWVSQKPGVEVALDEATVHSPRRAWSGGKKLMVDDAVHKQGSFHHQGLAADLNLYHNGEYISDGDDPLWKEIAQYWEGLHPLCTSGRRFQDGNHVSFGEADKSEPLS